jgi:transposase
MPDVLASLLGEHQDAVQRLAEVPGLAVHSAQQIIAEVGPTAATFPSKKCLSSWVGACPGDDETAGVNYSHRSPKGNRQMRRILNQAANAAAKDQRKHLRDRISMLSPALGTQSSHRSYCPSTASADLADSA